MNRSEYKDLQALADDLALLIELKKANERKAREDKHRDGGHSQIPGHASNVRHIRGGQPPARLLTTY